jgi:arsenite/tail-anchored protein-transporting ATPase
MNSLSDLGLEELLSTPPPGLDEAIAISKVVEFVESAQYARFTRIVFDTAPTGHTLRMLTLPDFVAQTLEKASALQKKLGGAGGGFVGALFGAGGGTKAVEQLRTLQDRVEMVSGLFRCDTCNVCPSMTSASHGILLVVACPQICVSPDGVLTG